eukprot:12292806-Alexandrium_andersonii.AAC.1
MSASLVGSEMCIRDRWKGVSFATTSASPSTGAGIQFGGHCGLGPEASRPVSYTHLTLPTICSV